MFELFEPKDTLFNYHRRYLRGREFGYMKFIIEHDQLNRLQDELNENFINYQLDTIRNSEGFIVIVGTVGIDFIGKKNHLL